MFLKVKSGVRRSIFLLEQILMKLSELSYDTMCLSIELILELGLKEYYVHQYLRHKQDLESYINFNDSEAFGLASPSQGFRLAHYHIFSFRLTELAEGRI